MSLLERRNELLPNIIYWILLHFRETYIINIEKIHKQIPHNIIYEFPRIIYNMDAYYLVTIVTYYV